MKPAGWLPPRVMTKINLQNWVETTKHKLEKSREFSALEVYSIASFVLDRPREWLIAHGETVLATYQVNALEEKSQQLISGVPLPYIINRQAFYGLDFYVTPDVLIPRPETELLIEQAIEWLSLNPDRRTLIDVGTGAGIIPVCLVDHFPDLSATTIDLSEKALKVAKINIESYQLQKKITPIHNDLLAGLDARADLITANLPYIPSERLATLEVARHEPLQALDGGEDGFEIIRRLLAQLPAHLNSGGLALFEIDYIHAEIAINEAARILSSAKISLLNDLANLPRLLSIQT